jgi:uncharacterized protein GlcG (DUF336 family)
MRSKIGGGSAKSVTDAAIGRATELRVAATIAVVDDGGHLKSLLRMDDAILGSIDIAQKKAKASAYFRLNSEELGQASQPGGPFFGVENSNGGIITFSGGVPLKNGAGEVCGAIGVSGGEAEQDAAIAQAGAAAFVE